MLNSFSDTSDVFYFLCLVKDDNEEFRIGVVDLSHAVSYKRNDYRTVDEENYSDLREAINEAHRFAKENNLPYEPFTSRYHSETSEITDDYDNSVVKEDQPYSFDYKESKRLAFFYQQGSRLPNGDLAKSHCFSEGSDVIDSLEECENIIPLTSPVTKDKEENTDKWKKYL